MTPEGRRWLENAPDEVIACKADHHPWPQLKIGILDPGIRVTPQHDGCWQLVILCPNCERQRTKTTLPRGRWDFGAVYQYTGGKDFSPPPGAGITKADYVAEWWRRAQEAYRPGPKARAS